MNSEVKALNCIFSKIFVYEINELVITSNFFIAHVF